MKVPSMVAINYDCEPLTDVVCVSHRPRGVVTSHPFPQIWILYRLLGVLSELKKNSLMLLFVSSVYLGQAVTRADQRPRKKIIH